MFCDSYVMFYVLRYDCLRTDSCDERRVYKSEDISGPKGDTYMFDTSPKSLDFCLSKDVS